MNEDQVLAVLIAGTAPTTPDLAEAVALYRAAGRAALRQQDGDDWVQARVRFPDWTAAESTAAHCLAPRLEALRGVRVLDSWWFLRKHPEWRLRCRPAEGGTEATMRHLGNLLTALTEEGTVESWRWSTYEPEFLAFGGPEAMSAAHALFAADSNEVLAHARHGRTTPGRRELSVVLCTAMLRSALLDPIERADVWQRVADSREREAELITDEQLAKLTRALHQLIHLDTRAESHVFAPEQALHFAAAWTRAFREAGSALAGADRNGQLRRGLRDVLATIVRHHWNRLGLPDDAQALLALATRQAEMTPYQVDASR